MKRLRESFEEAFDLSLDQFLPDERLYPLDGNVEDAMLFGSESVAKNKNACLIQGDIDRFIESGQEGYFHIGFWGHGVNSYAFYYCRADSQSRIFFRLGYGGIYMDNEKAAARIRRFLGKFMIFEAEMKKRGNKLIAVDSMGEGYYRVETKEGKVYELRKSLERDADFKRIFEHQVKK